MVKIIVTSAEDFKSWNTVLVAIRVFIFFWIFLDCIVYLNGGEVTLEPAAGI